jgi:hypothetical protein
VVAVDVFDRETFFVAKARLEPCEALAKLRTALVKENEHISAALAASKAKHPSCPSFDADDVHS